MSDYAIAESFNSIWHKIQEQNAKFEKLQERVNELEVKNDELMKQNDEKSDIIYRHGKLIHFQNKKIEELETYIQLIDTIGNKNCPNSRTPIYHMAEIGNVEKLSTYLTMIRDKNPQCDILGLNESMINEKFSDKGYTPLHIAILNGNIECVQILIDYGADVNIVDNNNLTPLNTGLLYWLKISLKENKFNSIEKLEKYIVDFVTAITTSENYIPLSSRKGHSRMMTKIGPQLYQNLINNPNIFSREFVRNRELIRMLNK
jgi:hypothetical protein